MTLTQYTQDGYEIVIDTNTGETFASIRAVAKMVEKDTKSITRFVNGSLYGVDKMELKRAEFHTSEGIQGSALLNEDQIVQVIYKYKFPMLLQFGALGLRHFLHTQFGYEHNTTDVSQITTEPLKVYSNDDGLELVIDTTTSEIFASISTVAAIAKMDTSALSNYIYGKSKMELKAAKVQTAKGIESVRLLNEDQISHVIYKYYFPLFRKFDESGIRAVLHPLVGYVHVFPEIAPQIAPKQPKKHSLIEYVNVYHYIEQLSDETLRELLTNQLIRELSELQSK